MRTFLYLCDWTAPEVLGPNQTRATGQVKLIEDCVLKDRVDGSGWAFPQHQAKPPTNGIIVFCPEKSYDALVAITGIKLLHEMTETNDAKIAWLVGMSSACCVVRDGTPHYRTERLSPWNRRAFIGVMSAWAISTMINVPAADVKPGATLTAVEVKPEDKTALVTYLTSKNYDKDPLLSTSVKAVWAPTEVSKVVEQVKITDTKVLAYETMKSPLFGWINQTLANVGLT